MPRPQAPAVLIVEDDPATAALEKRHLERAGYSAVTAATADEAIQQLGRGRYELLVLDFRLPEGVDGLAFYHRLQEGGHDLPVILVTGFCDEATVIRALRAGVRDVVPKTVEYLEYLPDAVGRVLREVGTEQQLAASEARLAGIIESAKDAILVTEADRRITLVNAAAERMFRCPAADALGQPLIRFLPREVAPVDGGPDDPSVTSLVRAGSRGVRADGTEFPLEASYSRVEVGGRKIYTVVVRDVTERHKAEAALREQAALLAKANDAILVQDLDDRITFFNPSAARLYEWTAAEAVGRSAEELLHKPGQKAEREEARRTLLAKGEWKGELRQVTKTGKELTIESHWTLVRDDDGRPHSKLVINADITERKRLEAQLLQAQRMESVGVLAGGVAHDFNNMLTVITGCSEILLNRAETDQESRELIEEIRKAGERAALLTRQLLAFSRKQILRNVVLDLNVLIHDMEKLLRRLIGEDIDLAAVLAPGGAWVRADPGQLQQVIMNLAVNARDAMPTGGHLTIATHHVNFDPGYTAAHPYVRPGPYVLLAVTDTGVGMDAATQEHIFDPFFTTKGVGQGTGLGLATVYGIVKQSDGSIEVYSEPGHGTAFKIYLPRIDEAAALRTPPETAAVPPGKETILLAEDEEGVRTIIRLSLAAAGYTVLESRNVDEAIETCRDYQGQIHLLLTDVVMPKLSGRQLADLLVAMRPGMKVLYMSGYTDDSVVRHGVLGSGMAFLQKPFAPLTLARKVREVLDT
jgi:PAS domain S-box-containing protein